MLLLSKIDVLGTPATLNFFGDNKKRSSFGGICSLIFFSFILWTIYNSSYDLLTRINPATTVGEVNIEEPPIINMSNSAFPVAFIVQTPSTLQATGFTDETIYKIEVQHKRLDRIQQPNGTVVKVWTYTNLTTEPCTKEYFGQFASSFASFTFKGSHCISQNQTGLDQILLQGITSSPVYQALTARIKACTNDTSNVTCASPTKIKQYLSGSYFSAMYLDTVIDIQNFTNPMTKFRELYYTLMNPLSYKTLDIEVGNVQLTSDAGWVTESKTIETSLQVNKVNELIDLNPSLDNTLILCTFKTSRTQTYYTRTYKKIPTILAEVGGVANTALAVLLILTTPYLRLKSREALMNRIFKVEAASPKKSEGNKKKAAKLDEKKKVNNKLQKNRESNRSSRSREDNQKTHGIVTTLTTEAAPFHTYVHPTSPHEPLDSQRIQLMPTSSNPLEKNPTFTFNEPEPTSRRDSSRHSIPAADHNDPENFLRLSQFSRESSIPQEKDVTPTRLFARRNQPSMAQGDNLEGKNNIMSGDDFENEIEIQLESIKEKVAEEGDDDLEGGDYEARLPPRLNDGITDKEKGKQREEEEEEEELEDVDKGDETEREAQEIQPVKKEKKEKNEKKERWLINLRRKLGLSTSELQMWEYLMSFVYKPKSLKEKIEILEHGVKNIDQRLDLSNILKKFCEVDKLIALLLDSDQIELFNNMPNPEIRAPQDRFELMRRSSFERNLQRQIALTDTPKTKKQILQCYNRLKLKEKQDKIDKRLIEIFSEIDT